MLALAPRSRSYPVLFPDRPAGEGDPVRHRARRRPLSSIVGIAIIAVLPAVMLVSQRTEAARTGYAILELRRQIGALQAENARLVAQATTLRAPDRIERLATADLGMVTPRPQQVAALPIMPPAVAVADVPAPTLMDRLAAWFVRSEAAAGEPPQ